MASSILKSFILTQGESIRIFDNLADLIATTPNVGIAFITETSRFYVADGTNWQEGPIVYTARTGKDMGFEQNSPLTGYGDTFFTDKTAHNMRILGSVVEDTGSIRSVRDSEGFETFEVYLNGDFRDLPADITFVEGDGNYTHTIRGEQIEIMSGNSLAKGLNGLPMIQQYKKSMGAFPVPIALDGNIP